MQQESEVIERVENAKKIFMYAALNERLSIDEKVKLLTNCFSAITQGLGHISETGDPNHAIAILQDCRGVLPPDSAFGHIRNTLTISEALIRNHSLGA